MAGESKIPAGLKFAKTEEDAAGNVCIESLYGELCLLAKSKLYRESSHEIQESAALVDEVWLKLGGEKQPEWASRAQFFAAAAKAMRRILIESARHRKALRHGGNYLLVNLSSGIERLPDPASETHARELLLSLNEALAELARNHPESSRLIQLHYFWGLTLKDAANEVEISLRTAHRRLKFGLDWLRMKLEEGKSG